MPKDIFVNVKIDIPTKNGQYLAIAQDIRNLGEYYTISEFREGKFYYKKNNYNKGIEDVTHWVEISGLISVKDRMPEKDGQYLVKRGEYDVLDFAKNKFRLQTYPDYDISRLVTHWKKIPKSRKDK